MRRARMEGFLVFDHGDRYTEAIADLGRWAAAGVITHHVDVVDGFDNVPPPRSRACSPAISAARTPSA